MVWIVVAVIAVVLLFVVKRPLRLAPETAAGGAIAPPLACPSCGTFYPSALSASGIVRCPQCGTYARFDLGQGVSAIPQDFVASAHVFKTYLPEAPTWPACCCVCGAPPTRTETMTITYAADPTFEERLTASVAVRVASAGMVKVTEHHVNVTERYRVPHCDAHSGGARLEPSGVAFRSYAYFRNFVGQNRATIAG
jgi:hypothetical protein